MLNFGFPAESFDPKTLRRIPDIADEHWRTIGKMVRTIQDEDLKPAKWGFDYENLTEPEVNVLPRTSNTRTFFT